MITLAALEEITGASGIAPRIEAVLPIGVRSRQLRVRTLLAGMCLTQADGRPAHLTRVHQALTSLPGEEQRRPGVITEWKHGPHLLTYRQAEYTSGLIAGALGKQEPDGLPSAELQAACDDLPGASIPDQHKTASAALAVDWTDMETFSRPPPKGTSDCADPEASWGHRKNNLLRGEDELFFGYYFSAGIMMPDEHSPPVPEYARRITISSCRRGPCPRVRPRPDRAARRRDRARRHPRRLRLRLPHPGELGGPAARRRRPAHPGPAPIRPRAARHPPRRHHLQRQPVLPPGTPHPAPARATGPRRHPRAGRVARHPDRGAGALADCKLGRITSDDPDGYHRVMCPAVMGKIRCPLRPASMTLDRDRPEILTPPQDPPACCTQQTLTVPPDTLAKTAQKHDYPSAAHRRSYARRTGAERGFATLKDPASNDISRGWCRLMGLAPRLLFTTCLTITRNQRITAAWDRRQEASARRAAAGLPPRTRRRRRKPLASLAAAPP